MLEARDICKRFTGEGSAAIALDHVSLTVEQGAFVAIMGKSGSGKTTLLNTLSTLLAPDSGALRYQGRDIASFGENERNALRHKDFAIVFQFHHLLPYLTALENTLLPFMNALKPVPAATRAHAIDCLRRVGLEDKHDRLPAMLSGGEQQRVAIARALAKNASILFADEPTGSLDKQTGEDIMRLLTSLHRQGLTIVMVTHDPDYAAWAERVVRMRDGVIVAS
ncbi:MAG: ABC transporter ATP-binding protein [Desulfovibrionaceae bacterium]